MRILLADDHTMFLDGLEALLARSGLDVVAKVADGREAVQMTRELAPDVTVLDLAMPVMNGVTAARQIHKLAPETQTILLTMFEDDAYVLEALQAGVRGYVLKAQAPEELVSAVREVMRGSVYLSPGVSKAVVDAYLGGGGPPNDALSDRERQILQLIAEGNTTKEAARTLGVSVKTAEAHRTRVMQKLEVHDTASLVRRAIRLGVIQP
ncbi:MAG: response regulator transcription factor [Halofilum sp. (in: g-proteobacteria)]